MFASWFRLADGCPSCGLRLERGNDFFLGGYVISLAITEGLLALLLFAYVLRSAADPGSSKVPVLLAGFAIAVVAPVVTYPFSRTIWAAIDLAMRPAPADDDTSGGGPSDP